MKILRGWNKRKLIFGLVLLSIALMLWFDPDIDEVVGPFPDGWNYFPSYTTMTVQSMDEWLEVINANLITEPPPTKQVDAADVIKARMRHIGLESVDLHEFKSPYIRDPKVYHKSVNPRVEGKRERKIISCFACPRWYRSYDMTAAYNRDFKVCPYRECYFDHTGRKHKEAALVMFFSSQYPSKMPEKTRGQIWMNAKWEPSPYYVIRSAKDYDSFRTAFNWTVGYSQDDDLFWPLNFLGWRARSKLLSDEEYNKVARSLTKTAMWWPSTHCVAYSQRESYIKELQKYVDIDTFGTCGDIPCKDWTDCAKYMNGTYKFHLSFENSFCKDFLTDEFFRVFSSRRMIVPVVRGGFEYEKHFPPKTLINANDFKSAKQLGMFLKELANDIPSYVSYLKEKDKLTVLNYKNDWCDLCEMLHTNVKQRIIPDVRALTHAENICWTKDDIL